MIGLEANVPEANAHAKLETEAATLEKTHTSSVIETGNSATQATIGELVTFEVSATLPAGTAFGGEAQITDPGIPTTRLTYETGSAEALVDGSARPGGISKSKKSRGARSWCCRITTPPPARPPGRLRCASRLASET